MNFIIDLNLNKNLKKVNDIVSVMAAFILLFAFSFFGLVLNPLICFFTLRGMLKKEYVKIPLKSEKTFVTLFLQVIILFFFCKKWVPSAAVGSLSSLIGIPNKFFVLMVGIVLCFLSFYAIYNALDWSYERMAQSRSAEIDKEDESMILPIVVCALTAIGIMTFCAKSSFLYPYNDWYDPNCFFTVGKSMLNGVVPYRDLNEQKGPLLYLVHGFAWLLSHKSFIGIYLLETVNLYFFLYYAYKIMRLYAGRSILALVPVLGMVSCTSNAFYGGDSAEELSWAFSIICLFIFLKNAKKGTFISRKEAILVGLYSGCIFWIKFSLLGMYLGWYFVFVHECIRKKKQKQLWQTTLNIIFGVLLSSIPFFIYFGITGALGAWLGVYVWENVIEYTLLSSIPEAIENMVHGFYNIVDNNLIIHYLLQLGLAFMVLDLKGYERAYAISMCVCEFILIFIGGQHYFYYSLIMAVYALFGLLFLYRMFICQLMEKVRIPLRSLCIAASVLCIAVAAYITPNRYLRGVDQEELPQWKMLKYIEKDDDPTLLNYGFLDGGFYTIFDILPSCYYFCKTNMVLPEMLEEQDRYVKEGLTDYVIARREIESDKYDLIATCDDYSNGISQPLHYFLYKHK